MEWSGFRRVRGQVCKRLRRRLDALGLPDLAAYRERLASDADEWRVLESCCRVTISRFYRDCRVFEILGEDVLPRLAAGARQRGAGLRCWSAGCASGEEPYTLAIVWAMGPAAVFPDVALEILATDSDETMLARAEQARYPRGSLRELPAAWTQAAFARQGGDFVLRPLFYGPCLFQGRAGWVALVSCPPLVQL